MFYSIKNRWPIQQFLHLFLWQIDHWHHWIFRKPKSNWLIWILTLLYIWQNYHLYQSYLIIDNFRMLAVAINSKVLLTNTFKIEFVLLNESVYWKLIHEHIQFPPHISNPLRYSSIFCLVPRDLNTSIHSEHTQTQTQLNHNEIAIYMYIFSNIPLHLTHFWHHTLVWWHRTPIKQLLEFARYSITVYIYKNQYSRLVHLVLKRQQHVKLIFVRANIYETQIRNPYIV